MHYEWFKGRTQMAYSHMPPHHKYISFFKIFFAAILRQTLFLNSAKNLNFKEFLTSFRQILKEISFQSLCVLISYSDLVVRFT